MSACASCCCASARSWTRPAACCRDWSRRCGPDSAGRLGSGRQYVPWIHGADLARAILFVLDQPAIEGPVNAVAPDPPTQSQFIAALSRVLGKPARLPVPAFALRLLLGRKAEIVLASQRAVPNALRAAGFRFEYGDLDAALADLVRS
jgi:NAD dependent epimerase/dehydratase family enzyme